MIVPVNQPRDDDHPAQVNYLICGGAARQALHRADLTDGVAFNAYPAIANDVAIGVDRDDVSVRQ
jgi:hypothetical protein